MENIKLVITKADNGYIVKSLCCGLSTFHEPYIKPLAVFETFQKLNEYLEKILSERNMEQEK